MFPVSYVEVTEPLPEESLPNKEICKVIAVFAFKPECWDDLSINVISRTAIYTKIFVTIINQYLQFLTIQEGDEIQVLRRINDDWLYGECNGSKGQFPSNFVTELPDDL